MYVLNIQNFKNNTEIGRSTTNKRPNRIALTKTAYNNKNDYSMQEFRLK